MSDSVYFFICFLFYVVTLTFLLGIALAPYILSWVFHTPWPAIFGLVSLLFIWRVL